MKNRNIDHSNDWATPPLFYDKLNSIYHFNFDPCPFGHNLLEWDGVEIGWSRKNFVNPGYEFKLKTSFVLKGIEESKNGNLCVFLLPVSTSTKLFHDHIKPNARSIEFVKGRIPFIGINTKGEYVNWHLWDKKAPDGVVHVKNCGMHDSMIVIFGDV